MVKRPIVLSMAAGLLAVASFGVQPALAAGEQGRATSPSSISVEQLGSSEIRDMQRVLNEEGFAAGPVDGVFGPNTRGALVDFQRSMGIEPTGDLNERTVLALGIDVSEPTPAAPTLSESDVRQVQQALNQAGYNAGRVDGIWGPQTRSALSNFQESEGLEPTGQLNDRSLLALGISVSEFAAGEFEKAPTERDVPPGAADQPSDGMSR